MYDAKCANSIGTEHRASLGRRIPPLYREYINPSFKFSLSLGDQPVRPPAQRTTTENVGVEKVIIVGEIKKKTLELSISFRTLQTFVSL